MIVCLGSVAARNIIDKDIKINKVRGEFINSMGYDIISTYHPTALLHNPKLKKDAWEDFKKIKKRLLEYEQE